MAHIPDPLEATIQHVLEQDCHSERAQRAKNLGHTKQRPFAALRAYPEYSKCGKASFALLPFLTFGRVGNTMCAPT